MKLLRNSLILTLIICAAAFAQSGSIPGEILLRIDEAVRLIERDGNIRTGIPDFDRILDEIGCRDLRQPLMRGNIGSYHDADKVLLLKISPDRDLSAAIAKIRTHTSVSWAGEHHLLHADFVPNDPYFNQQYYLHLVNAPAAWDLASGAEQVVIGIIDCGIDFNHPDLAERIWANPGEIPNNGLDDDNNGYVDDVRGWDFVDFPELPLGYDYLHQDNDPMDTFGHGTQVAGIAAAVVNNGIGIAGTAVNGKLAALRVGSQNFFPEIAVAQAIIYAVDMGITVLNLSFSSQAISPLLGDIIEFAAGNDVVIIASSGDNASLIPNYPAGFDQTISVGAVDQNDNPAEFSAGGNTLDLSAPGVDILTTGLNGEYLSVSGTSFAAPIVAAAAAMIRGINPGFSADDVRGILLNSAKDIAEPGWDSYTGQGRVDIEKALLTPEALVAQITSPAAGSGFSGDTLQIKGTAAGLYVTEYKLSYGIGDNPDEWTVFRQISASQVIAGNLGILIFNPTFQAPEYTLKLEVTDQFGITIEDRVVFDYITQPPQISVVNFYSALEGEKYASIISFKTDQRCRSTLFISSITTSDTLNYTYPDTIHRMVISGVDLPEAGLYDCRIAVENLAGMTDTSEVFPEVLDFTQTPFNTSLYYIKNNNVLPDANLLAQTVNLDGDLYPEVFAWDYADNILKRYEYSAAVFSFTGGEYGNYPPLDLGDSDGDGLIELMTGKDGSILIFEQVAAGSSEMESVYNGIGEIYGLNLLDLYENDGQGEFFLRENSQFKLYHRFPDGSVSEAVSFTPPDYTGPGALKAVWGDFNLDGEYETVFGDEAGRIFIYTLSPQYQMTEIFRDSLPFSGTAQFIASGDFDGDDIDEFICGCHTEPQIYNPNERISYWTFYIYDFLFGGGFYRCDSLYFIGVSDTELLDAGMSSADIDADGVNEIALSIHPNLYLLDYLTGEYTVLWNYSPCESNSVLMQDLNSNGQMDLVFNRGEGFARFEQDGVLSIPTPMGLTVTIVDENTLELNWLGVSDTTILGYQIFCSNSPDNLQTVDFVPYTTNFWFHGSLTTDSIYYYAVASYKSGAFSPLSDIVSGIPNTPPVFVDLRFEADNPKFLRIIFSEPMSEGASNPNHYHLDGGMGMPLSVAPAANDTMFILAFEQKLSSNYPYKLLLSQMLDKQGAIFEPDTIQFLTPDYFQEKPYLKGGSFNNNKVNLEFSIPMNLDSLAAPAHYTITYGTRPDTIDLVEVVPDTNNTRRVSLYVSPNTPLGAMGHIYIVRANNVYSAADPPMLIDNEHSAISLSSAASSLKNVYVYPSPYRLGDLVGGEECVIIANVTAQAKVRIYNMYGELVRKLEPNLTLGGVKWYLDNDKGEKIASGIYLYCVENDEDRVFGKIAVMR